MPLLATSVQQIEALAVGLYILARASNRMQHKMWSTHESRNRGVRRTFSIACGDFMKWCEGEACLP